MTLQFAHLANSLFITFCSLCLDKAGKNAGSNFKAGSANNMSWDSSSVLIYFYGGCNLIKKRCLDEGLFVRLIPAGRP